LLVEAKNAVKFLKMYKLAGIGRQKEKRIVVFALSLPGNPDTIEKYL